MKNVYNRLTEIHVHWDRIDDNTIVVYTPGYLTQECHNLEKFLLENKVRAVSQKFDEMCGKTKTVYKHK